MTMMRKMITMTGLDDLMEFPEIKASIALGKIALPHSNAVTDWVVDMPGAKFVGNGRDYWTLPLSWTSLLCLRFTFGDSLVMSDDLLAWANMHWESVVEPCINLRTGDGEAVVDDSLLERFNKLLPSSRSALDRRYQVAGALLLTTAERFLLLDEQGLGKMTQGATALSLWPETRPALIVAPASVMYSWRRELDVFGVEATILEGTAPQRRKVFEKFDAENGVLITSYGMLSKHSRVAGYGDIKLSDDHRTPKELNEIPWATTLGDEIHRAKNPHAVQTRALWAASSTSRYRWGMTGTPIESTPLELWALLHFILPEEFTGSGKFRDRWLQYHENWFGVQEIDGIRQDRKEEYEKVTQLRWRRKMAEPGKLPPFRVETRYCELKGKHLTAYKAMAKQLMAEVPGATEDITVLFAENHMVKSGRLLQLANSMVEAEELQRAEDEEGPRYEVTPILPSPKIDLLIDTLQDFEGTPLIVWFDSRKFMDLARQQLDKAGYVYSYIDGTRNAKQRDEAVQQIQDGTVDMILINVSAGSEGITITRPPVAIYAQRSFSSIKNWQSKYRNLRIGSEEHDEILHVNLICRDTIEEDQHEMLADKERIRDDSISPNALS